MVKRPKSGPGRSDRKGLSITELFALIPNDDAAEKWLIEQRWPNGGRFCPDCGGTRTYAVKSRKPMPYRCPDCRGYFSVRKGTIFEASPIPLQKWVIALYMMTTGIKGTSSMKLHRELRVKQQTAWFMMHRIREAFNVDLPLPSPGPVEIDETFIGGKLRNMHKHKRPKHATGGGNKAIVVGARHRDTKQLRARVVGNTDQATLRAFVQSHVMPESEIFTDEHKGYNRSGRRRYSVSHSAGEYVRGRIHTNGIESMWALFKRGFKGTYHKMSKEHLGRYVNEFVGRNNIRDLDTHTQMHVIVRALVGKRLTYKELIDRDLAEGKTPE